MTQTGKVYLVGAGPGDADLLTRKAERVLRQADVVLFDRLVSAEVLALCSPQALLVDCGKQWGEQDQVQERIFKDLLNFAGQGLQVVRLKSGDPMIFSRGSEELEFLAAHGIPAEVVPGLSSALAGPAIAGLPLTRRGIAASFAVIAGHRQSVSTMDYRSYAGIDTLVVLMGVEHRDVIAGCLIEAGRTAGTPVLFLERVSTSEEKEVESTLGEVARRATQVAAPALMVVGEVVRLRQSARKDLEAGLYA